LPQVNRGGAAVGYGGLQPVRQANEVFAPLTLAWADIGAEVKAANPHEVRCVGRLSRCLGRPPHQRVRSLRERLGHPNKGRPGRRGVSVAGLGLGLLAHRLLGTGGIATPATIRSSTTTGERVAAADQSVYDIVAFMLDDRQSNLFKETEPQAIGD